MLLAGCKASARLHPSSSQRRDGRFVRANFSRIRVSAGSGRRAAQEFEAVTLCSPQRRALAATSLQCAQVKNVPVRPLFPYVTINYKSVGPYETR